MASAGEVENASPVSDREPAFAKEQHENFNDISSCTQDQHEEDNLGSSGCADIDATTASDGTLVVENGLNGFNESEQKSVEFTRAEDMELDTSQHICNSQINEEQKTEEEIKTNEGEQLEFEEKDISLEENMVAIKTDNSEADTLDKKETSNVEIEHQDPLPIPPEQSNSDSPEQDTETNIEDRTTEKDINVSFRREEVLIDDQKIFEKIENTVIPSDNDVPVDELKAEDQVNCSPDHTDVEFVAENKLAEECDENAPQSKDILMDKHEIDNEVKDDPSHADDASSCQVPGKVEESQPKATEALAEEHKVDSLTKNVGSKETPNHIGITARARSKFERKPHIEHTKQKSLDKDNAHVKHATHLSKSTEDPLAKTKTRGISTGKTRVHPGTADDHSIRKTISLHSRKSAEEKEKELSSSKSHTSVRKCSDSHGKSSAVDARKVSTGAERKPFGGERKISVGRDRLPSGGVDKSATHEARGHIGPGRKTLTGTDKHHESSTFNRPSTGTEKRAAFGAKGRAATVSAADHKRADFGKNRTSSLSHDTKTARAQSVTTKQTTLRKTSTSGRGRSSSGTDEEPKLTPSQIRARFEAKSGGKSHVAQRPGRPSASTTTTHSRFQRPVTAHKTSIQSHRKPSVEKKHEDGDEQITPASIRAKFEGNKKTSAVEHRKKVTPAANKPRTMSATHKAAGNTASKSCVLCGKTVYPMEKIEADAKLYHKFCFKCEECKCTLRLGNYASLSGKIYCKPHFKQLFRLKGNYDEGFGRQQHKKQWSKKDAPEELKPDNLEATNPENEKDKEENTESPDTNLPHAKEDITEVHNEVFVEA